MIEETAAAVMERAAASYQRDVRFRAIAQSVVAQTMRKHGPIDPECADQEAHDVALDVAVLLLQRVYEDDAELNALRTERDAYKEQCLKLTNLVPPVGLVDLGYRPQRA